MTHDLPCDPTAILEKQLLPVSGPAGACMIGRGKEKEEETLPSLIFVSVRSITHILLLLPRKNRRMLPPKIAITKPMPVIPMRMDPSRQTNPKAIPMLPTRLKINRPAFIFSSRYLFDQCQAAHQMTGM
jgi:hypothetical protein